MKNLLLILPLLIVGCATTPVEDLRASGEDFPLQFTCELGHLIKYISFDVDGIATFFYHESNIANKKNIGKKIKINGYTLTENQIKYEKWNGLFYLNRLNGKAEMSSGPIDLSGECFKGFKEYEKQI